MKFESRDEVPRRVKLDDDELVLGDEFGEIGMV